MALPIQVNPQNPFIDIHTGRGQGSCTFANGFDCVCSCAGIAHAQLLRMVLTPENSKELPDKYKQALANKVQTVQARIADIPHDKVTTIIHAQKQPKRVFFLCEDVSHPIIDYCRVIDILRWARENPLASQQVSRLCTCVQNHGINSFNSMQALLSSVLTLLEFCVKWPGFCSAFIVRRLAPLDSYNTRFPPLPVSCSPGTGAAVSSSTTRPTGTSPAPGPSDHGRACAARRARSCTRR